MVNGVSGEVDSGWGLMVHFSGNATFQPQLAQMLAFVSTTRGSSGDVISELELSFQ